MDRLNILVTGVGAPGIKGTVYSLRNNYDNRKVRIIGTDVQKDVIGKYICDKYYQIPSANDKQSYLNTLINICNDEKVDVLLPQNTLELEILAHNKNIFKERSAIILSELKAIKKANNKYSLMKECLDLNIPVGKFHLVDNFNDLLYYSKKLGWPHEKIVIKPPIANGLRGVRIIDENIDLKKMFYEEKPTSLYILMKDLEKILGNNFPDLIVTEFLPGDEYSVDIFRNGDNIIVIPRKRDMIRSGITFNGTVKYHKEIIRYSKKLSRNINLKYCFGFQFKLDKNGVPKILECNPRVQGTMVMATLAGANVIYSAVKTALNEEIPEFNIKWGVKFLRYWGGVCVYKDEKILEI